MPIPIVRRPGIPTSVGDHETRIRALERRLSSSRSSYQFIKEVVLAVDTSGDGMVLSDIPQTFRHLRLYAKLRGTGFTGTAAVGFNGIYDDSAHAMFFVLVQHDIGGGHGFTPATDWDEAGPQGFFGSNTFYISSDSANPDPDGWSTLILEIPYYREPVYKNVVGELLGNTQDTTPYYTSTELKGIWRNTDAISSIYVAGFDDVNTLKAGCKASLYGIM